MSKFDEIWDYVASKGDFDDEHIWLIIFTSDMHSFRKFGHSITGEKWVKTPDGPRIESRLT